MELLDRASRYVAKMPAAVSGQGGHDATFHVACVLVQGFGLSPAQAMPILQEFNQRCDPPWSVKELEHKLKGADKAVSARGRGWLAKGAEWAPSAKWLSYHSLPEQRKAAFNAEKLAKLAGKLQQNVNLVWLANRSVIDPATVTATQFLGKLYQEGEKVCVFTSDYASTIGRGVTLWPDTPPPLEGPEPRPCGVWFLAQPVDGNYHPTDEGDKMSCRNHRAITAWRYMVIESDEADTRQWLRAIVQLPLRISALYSSGGRSVHALVRLDARTKADWDQQVKQMEPVLVELGADPKSLTAVRLTRLPGCVRHGKMITEVGADGQKVKRYQRFNKPKRQKLLYINPRPELVPIADLFTRRDVVKHWSDLASQGVADGDETGGAWIEEALEYYAGVSTDLLAALHEWKGGSECVTS